MQNRFKIARKIYNQNGAQTVKEVVEQSGIKKTLLDEIESEYELISKKRGVSYLTIVKLAQYYGVSLDWLVGLSENPSINTDDKFLTDIIGFSPAAVSRLKAFVEGRPQRVAALSILLEQDDFAYILDDILHCTEFGQWQTPFEQSMKGNESEEARNLCRQDRNMHKTAAVYGPQFKLGRICDSLIMESEKGAENNGVSSYKTE